MTLTINASDPLNFQSWWSVMSFFSSMAWTGACFYIPCSTICPLGHVWCPCTGGDTILICIHHCHNFAFSVFDRYRTILRCYSLQLTCLSMLQLRQLKLTGGVWRNISPLFTVTQHVWRMLWISRICHWLIPKDHCLALPAPGGYLP